MMLQDRRFRRRALVPLLLATAVLTSAVSKGTFQQVRTADAVRLFAAGAMFGIGMVNLIRLIKSERAS